MQIFGQIVTHHAVMTGDLDDGSAAVFHDHADVARAVRAGHPQRARQGMQEHVARVVAHLEQFPETSGDRIVTWL